MRVTAHSGLSVSLLLLIAPLFAQQPGAETPVVDALASLAGALSRNDAPGALAVFDSKIPAFEEIETNIGALVSQTDILCAIDIVEARDVTSGKDVSEKELDVDWYMQLKSQVLSGPSERRRERIILHMKLLRGKWKITSISPRDILAPLLIH